MQRALLIFLIAAAYLLLAGGPVWTRPLLWVIAGAAVMVAPRLVLHFPRRHRPLDLALLALLAGTALQAVPLPDVVVQVLSPGSHAAREATRFSVSARSSMSTLSLNPAATLQALSASALAVATFWIARGTFSAGGTRQFARWLGALAGVFTAHAFVLRTVFPGLLMGVVRPETRSANPMGPFLNRNHFAAWMLMAAATVSGYLVAHLHIHPSYRGPRAAAIKQFLISGAMVSNSSVGLAVLGLLSTLSRSALIGLAASALAAGWVARDRLRTERSGVPQVFAWCGVLLLVGVAALNVEAWAVRLQQSVGIAGGDAFDRLTIWRESWPMMRDFPLFGTGFGAYGEAMAYYQQSRFWVGSMQAWAFFNNAHSQYVQLLAEGGVILAGCAVAASVAFGRLALQAIRADKGEIYWIRLGAAAALVGVAVQGFWEVPLLMPANAVLAGTLAGLVLHQRQVADGHGRYRSLD